MAITDPFAQKLLDSLVKTMNEELAVVAEPIIKKAVEDVEKQLRRRMAEMVVALVQRSYSARMAHDELHIVVHMQDKRS